MKVTVKTHEWPPGSGQRYRVLDAGKVHGLGTRLAVDLGELAQLSGIRCDCENCVVSRAIKRELGALACYTGYRRVWALRLISVGPYRGQTVWERWAHDSERALRIFDNGGEPPTKIVLRSPAGTETQEAKAAANAAGRADWPATEKSRGRKINRGKARYAGMGGRNMGRLTRTKETA